MQRRQLPWTWYSSLCGTEGADAARAYVPGRKQRQRAIDAAINTPTLLDLWATEGVSSASAVPVSGLTQCENSALPGRHESLLPCNQRNGLGQALCQPGERSKVIVICDTMAKGAAMKSAVIMACRPSNEASALPLLFIVCCSGTLCSLFTDS